ncbi:MAG: hypothetical protein KC441_02940 [Anaerolineales bacterium]|nr:hypothetical protein [Anaerolineales bacterium]
MHQEPVYLLQNGDFHDSDTGWILDYDNGLPETVSNQRLFLGSSDYSCSNGVPIGFAQAKLTLTVPDGYQLQFEYTVHTQDKLGGPNNGLYDSFDVYVNTAEPPDILRTGNLTQPAGCANWYAISGIQTVAQYSGAITITFENWNRYDHWYNTYTELRRVWVVKR